MSDVKLTNDEWRAFQQIPDQGYSHRGWVDARIAERVESEHAEVERLREALDAVTKPVEAMWSRAFEAGQQNAEARLTGQLQAIERAWAARTGWSEFGTQVRAILDAAADEPKRMLLTHPHDGHGPDDTCFECAADGGE